LAGQRPTRHSLAALAPGHLDGLLEGDGLELLVGVPQNGQARRARVGHLKGGVDVDDPDVAFDLPAPVLHRPLLDHGLFGAGRIPGISGDVLLERVSGRAVTCDGEHGKERDKSNEPAGQHGIHGSNRSDFRRGGAVNWERRAQDLERLYRVGVALSAEQDKDRLIERILLEAKDLTRADGGTVYLAVDEQPDELAHDVTHLRFAMLRNDTLGIAQGGTTGVAIQLAPVPLYDEHGRPNQHNVASHCAMSKHSVNVADAYTEPGFDFSGTKAFDDRTGYRSRSFLTIPMVSAEGRLIGVLQLINARDEKGDTVAFDARQQEIVEALASQAAIALDNQQLLAGQKALLESFIQLIANAIDAKSPYTGGHCTRVPIITEMLARAACDADDGPFKDFSLSAEEWYELRIASWLHDCGKVVTPVHVMDKATKLETIHDRIEVIRARFQVRRLELELEAARAEREAHVGSPTPSQTATTTTLAARLSQLDDDLAFLVRANIGGEYLSPEKQARILAIAETPVTIGGKRTTLLTEDEAKNLCISRGTLTEDERLVINGHMVQTIRMLESLPFPRNLRKVPEIAGGHHEKMDGTGYPRGLWAGDMSLPARMMAIADVFEALTAQDRPYKSAKTLSETMKIMGFMKRDNHLDPALFDLFVSSGIYRTYAREYLPRELIDDVDEEALLALRPAPFTAPPPTERATRRREFLPAYRRLLR
jgi:HD-GYP domain-containing protein (c-di-GMP phosphodiesterase class II)